MAALVAAFFAFLIMVSLYDQGCVDNIVYSHCIEGCVKAGAEVQDCSSVCNRE